MGEREREKEVQRKKGGGKREESLKREADDNTPFFKLVCTTRQLLETSSVLLCVVRLMSQMSAACVHWTMYSPHICRGCVLGLVVGATEEGQRGRGEECVPVHE